MNAWLEPVVRAMDGAPGPVSFFFRDDDAGAADERLYRLVDLFAMYRAPLDLAVIPDALEARLAKDLVEQQLNAPERLGLHQHGFRHANHEPAGRKAEFGASRTPESQLADIATGRQRLELLLGTHFDPFFTPPWNRCCQATADVLVRLGFTALSRDLGAEPLDLQGLVEVSVSVDWTKSAVSGGPSKLAASIAKAIRAGNEVGVMLHHATMSEEQMQTLEQLLDLVVRHRRAHCRLMRDIVRDRTGSYTVPEPAGRRQSHG